MLPAPARDDARAFNAKVRRLADNPRTRRLDALEKLWKGKQYDGRPSFWDSEVPLNERAPCVQSSIAETAGRRITTLVFGNARFPRATVAESTYGQQWSESERELLGQLWTSIVEAAHLRVGMRKALEQGLMVGTTVAVGAVKRGRVCLELHPAKWCERELDDNTGEVTRLEIRYRHESAKADGTPSTVWFRRVIDAQSDTTWDDVPVDNDGFEPDWDRHPPGRAVQHDLGFCPVIWHRNDPDVSDSDPTDGTPLFEGLEDEIFAIDMAMSQRHRNGRYNGEPQIVKVGVDTSPASVPMGEPGRSADPRAGGFSWFSRVFDAAGRYLRSGGESATRKAPGTIWNLPPGGNALMLESTGAGAQILAGDIEGLRRTVLDARGVVLASPETISANASAALLKLIFEPTVAVADNAREEWGDVLVGVVNLLLRVAYLTASRGRSVFLRGLHEAMGPLGKAMVRIATEADGVRVESSEWVGVPYELAWGEYFEPTWQDVTSAIGAALSGNGGEPVLTLEQSVKLIAPIVGIEDVDVHVAKLRGETTESREMARDALSRIVGSEQQPAAPEAVEAPATDAPEKAADTALNGAQVASLLEIVQKVALQEIPRATGIGLITASFPLSTAQAESIMGAVGHTFFVQKAAPAPFGGGFGG